jgi:replicative DNA helicase
MQDFFETPETSSSTIQSQPHNRQAEEAVLGSALINPESFFDVAQILDADYFYIIRNRWIWEVFTFLHENRTPIDILTLSEELENRSQLEEIGGQAYLMMLINQTPSSLNAAAYAHIVEETFRTAAQCWRPPMKWPSWLIRKRNRLKISSTAPKNHIFDLSERRIPATCSPFKSVIDEYL